MQKIHTKLTQKYPKYHDWHQTKHHNKIHWGVFIVFTLLVFGTILRWAPISFAADIAAPTTPTNLTATAVSSSQIDLSWTASEDNVGVTGYKIYRCAGSACAPTTQIATSATNSYSNTGLIASTAYTYAVSAYDAAGNVSGKSGSVSGTTQEEGVVTSSNITSFQLTSAKTGALPFTTGLAFKKGDVPDVPVLDAANSQVIVKRRWNDGSVKHAIASGEVILNAGVPKTINISQGTSSGVISNLTAQNIQAASPSASVQLSGFGTVDLSSLLATPFRTWISGPEMVEAHYRSAVGNDPTLVVWFHVRLYKGGQIWIRAIVENGYLDIAAETKNYTAMVNINGVNSYTGNITHYPHTRWTAEGWIGGDPQVTPRLDTQYLIDTKLVPNYWKRNPSAAALDNLYQSYAPFEKGNWTRDMGDAGFQNQIGLLPLWDALYVSSGGDERAFKSVIANTKALNSYAIAWNDSVTKLPTIPSNRPRWTAYGEGAGGGGIQGAGTLLWELAHHGSGGYLAYLISGDYYFLETIQNQSSLCYLMNTSSNGSGTMRLFTSQTRSVAWCKRTVGQFAAIGPLDAITTDYQALLSSNVSHWKNEADRPGQNLIGYLYDYIIGTGGYGVGAVAPWQEHFWIQTYGHLSDLEPIANMADLNRVRDNLYKGIVGILGTSGENNYCYTEASRYTLTVAPESNSDPTTWYDSWGKVYEATHGSSNASCGTTLGGGSGGAPNIASTGYWGNLLPAIAYAVDHGAPGASASWSRLTNATNWSTVENSGFDDIPIWGIVPRTQLPVDTIPPTTPENLSAATVSATQINLSWNTSTDNIGVTGYNVYRNGALLATSPVAATTYRDTGLTPETTYRYAVSALDAVENESMLSVEASATTLALSVNPIDNLEPGHWYEVPNSKLRSVVPTPVPPGDPATVITAWSGGAFDTKRDHLIVWGGGHGNYAGNEIYVFDLNTLEWTRVNEPSMDVGGDECSGYYPDGNPRSRHTYNYVQYMASIDRFCTFGGAVFYPGGQCGTSSTDCFNFDTKRWERMADTTSPETGAFSAIDPVTGHVWQRGNVNNTNFSVFDPLNNTWTVRNQREDNAYMYRVTAAIDPVRRKFVAIGGTPSEGGGKVYSWDIGTPDIIIRQSLTTTGANEIIEVNNPGFEYDPISKKFVAWGGGANVYTLDMDTLVWTKHAPAPTNTVTPTAAADHGTYGRFRYSPNKNVFVVVNSIDENVYIYRLNPGGGTPPPSDTISPTTPINLAATPISSSQINFSWTASTDNIGVTGYKIYRCSGSSCTPTVQIATSATNFYSNTGLTASTAYTYAVSAYDAAGNESVKSSSVSVATLAGFKPSDLNKDAKVDNLDFEIFKLDFNRTDKPKSDLNQDGIVDSRDLGILMSSWEN